MKRRQGLRRSLSLLQELQGGKPSVISVNHYHGIWDRAIEEVTESDFSVWGGKIFELLSKEVPQEDVEEGLRACKRLNVHLQGLVEVTSDLVKLARQVDPRSLTEIYRKVDLLNKKARTLKATVGEMLNMRAASAKILAQAERSRSLVYQNAIFCNIFES